MTLYPGSLIYLLFPLPWSLSFFCLAHLFWGGLGMYFLALQWTNHRLAAALGGMIFSFNGLMLNLLMWPSHVATFSWLPWVLWLVPPGWRLGGKSLLWGSLVAALQILAGGPETIVLTWVLLFALACGEWVSTWGCSASLATNNVRSQITMRFAGIVLLVSLICAAQLLPFLQLLAHSQRDRTYGAASHDWSIPFWGWANFLVPLFRTSPTHQGVFLQNGQYWTSSYYAGIGTVLLIAVAVWRVRDWRLRLLAGLGFLGLVLACGDVTELYHILRSCFPGLGFVRYPVKFVILPLAVAPLLAACGLEAWASTNSRNHRFEWVCALVVLGLTGFVIALDWNTPMPGNDWRAKMLNGFSRAGFFVLVFTLLAWFLRSGGWRRVLWGGFLLGAFWFDLVTHVPLQNPTAPNSVYLPGWAKQQLHWDPEPQSGQSRVMVTAAAQAALKQSWVPSVEQNYLRNRLAAEVDCNLLDNVPHVDGFFSLVPRETYRLAELACGNHNQAHESLLDFIGVSEMTAPGTLTEWTPRRSFMPLVTCGQRGIFADDDTTLAALRQTNLDLRQVVFLPLAAREKVAAAQPGAATINNLEASNLTVSFEVLCSAPTVIVVAQTFYPAWKAYVDDAQTRVWRANYSFQALQVPTGRHRVRLVYEDRALQTGIVCSAVGLAAWIGLFLRAGRCRTSVPSQ
jgi:hypothetical protein